MTGKPKNIGNRLQYEKSPYLLQHADNPVDWYPWGEEAFQKAAAENKPIFLSIGYSTCHWCHVMAHESFADEAVARLLNQAFVCIKVDREERPDIDGIYMTACTMLTGSGGWPLTIVMTPDRQPFFAGTYFPKDNRPNRLGMLELIPRLRDIWQTRPREVMESAASIVENLRKVVAVSAGELEVETPAAAFRELVKRFDKEYGGFGHSPKFPSPHDLIFLLRYEKRTGDSRALAMVEQTLTAMRCGGLFDQVGFGFHRYSTDRHWLLPHFEKMLYDQAMLAMTYAEAGQRTGNSFYLAVFDEIFVYLSRDMRDAGGGFYSAEDADSEGEEGRFYLWTRPALDQVLGAEDAGLAARVFGVTLHGNFIDESTGKRSGASILNLGKSPEILAVDLGMPAAEFGERLGLIRDRLFAARQARVRPLRDDKILADWNGLLIAALAQGARITGDRGYLAAARGAADFVLKKMRGPAGRLMHRYCQNEAAIDGLLDDYAFMVWGLIELYQACFVTDYLSQALGLHDILLSRFYNRSAGGFFQTPDDGEDLLVRRQELYDGAIPSGNSVALYNLLRLGRLTGAPDLEDMAMASFKALAGDIGQAPGGHCHLLTAFNATLGQAPEVVVVGDRAAEDTQAMIRALDRVYSPDMLVLFKEASGAEPEISRIAPFTAGMATVDNRATAYVCFGQSCELPVTEIDVMLKMIKE